MEMLKRVLRGVLIWFATMFFMYLIFSSIYPSGAKMPIIFSFFILIFPIFCAVKFSKSKPKDRASGKKATKNKQVPKPVPSEPKPAVLHFPENHVDVASENKKFEVVILRKHQIQSAAKTYQIFLDGNLVAVLPNGGTARFKVSPGQHKLAFKGYLRMENFVDIFVGNQKGPARFYATISLKTGKIIVEDANGPEYDSVFSAQKPESNKVSARNVPAQKPICKSNQRSASMTRIDKMEGHEFEHFTADLLRKLGYERVEVTPGSGDQGVDVIAVKDGKRYAIQCKRYGQKLGNKPVQEVFAGKTIYGCSVAVVLTNSYFTESAKEAAKATGVELWDRDTLRRMMDCANFKALV